MLGASTGHRPGGTRRLDLVHDLVYSAGVIEVGVHEAKTNFSRLLRRVAGGEEVLITRGGAPVARLVPVQNRRRRVLGRDTGRIVIADDFDAPLPAEVLADFER